MIRAVLRIGCKGIQLFRFNALCGRLSTRSVVRRRGAPRPIPRAAARTLRTESYSRELSETQELQGPQGLVGMQRIEAPRNAGIRETHRNARPQEFRYAAIAGSSEPPRTAEAPVSAGIKAPHGPQKQQKQNSRNHRSRRNPGPQRPPVPPAETQKTLRLPQTCGSRRVRHRMPRPERSGKASVLLRLRCGAGIPARRAAPLPTSRRAVRPAPRPSRPPGRRNRADPYRRGSGDRRSRSPSGSPADRPCPGWRPR